MRQEKLTLRRMKGSFEVFHHEEQRTYRYEHEDSPDRYRISRIENASDSIWNLSIDTVNWFRLDTACRSVRIDYTDNGLVESVWLDTPRQEEGVLVRYGYDGEDDMTAITDAMGKRRVSV